MSRRRNPGGVLDWCSAHPWMTFFLVSAALAIPVGIAEALQPKAPPPVPTDPFGRLPSPSPSSAPAADPPTVFVPGVLDLHV